MSSNTQELRCTLATRSLAGIAVPDTLLVSQAITYAREHAEPFLFNHVMRSWLFAAALAEVTETPHDAEVLAVATVLHDLGLTKDFQGPLRFEVEGANAARKFALGMGVNDDRAQLVWDGVALNSTPSLALHKQPEVALCTAARDQSLLLRDEVGLRFDLRSLLSSGFVSAGCERGAGDV